MRRSGMPNKTGRALHEILETLAATDYLHPIGEETWKIVRTAD